MLVPASCSERLARGLTDATLMPMLGGHACNVTEPVIFDKILRGWLAAALLQGAA
jgi:aminoacrylate hydrolase